MINRREEILKAIAQAARTLNQFSVGSRTSFDIIRAVDTLDIPFMFRPLKGLWGASVSVQGDLQGILVTSKLDLYVQRFTLAHELGHVLLGHKYSFDQEISFTGRFGPQSRPTQELAAGTFASELLAARSLIFAQARRHKWTQSALKKPENIYQLSLRLGVSYQAACWALAAHKVLNLEEARRLQGNTVKDLKLSLVHASLLENPWANVWRLTEGDSGSFLEVGSEDIFAVHLEENSAAGFLWELVDAGPYSRILDEHNNRIEKRYGMASHRVVLLCFGAPGVHRLFFEHRRPWNKQQLAHIDISVDNHGKERGGLAYRVREKALALEEA